VWQAWLLGRAVRIEMEWNLSHQEEEEEGRETRDREKVCLIFKEIDKVELEIENCKMLLYKKYSPFD